ncbi:hypothetical protein GCM10010404_84150 [Nonomuraea africana]
MAVEQQAQLGVVEALAEHFDDLRDARTAAVAVEAIDAHLAAPDPSWEVILASGYVANWRLTSDPGGRPRVACTTSASSSLPLGWHIRRLRAVPMTPRCSTPALTLTE